MRNLKEVFESIEKSFDNIEVINFIDIRDLQEKIPESSNLFINFVKGYNERAFIQYSDLRELEIIKNAWVQMNNLPPVKTEDWWNDLYTDAGGTCFSDADNGL